MNMAITDGALLMPPAFANGLNVWSSGDGTPGSDTYEKAMNAAFVPADQDFGGCLELQKTTNTTRVRHMGETRIVPGCYLQVKARVKAISGSLPSVRISAYAALANGQPMPGVSTQATATALTNYGTITEVTAIIGVGNRDGVDMILGPTAAYCHFGIDLQGPNGGIVRIDDIEIRDVTSMFLRDLVPYVDVRDYGAIGDGATDDSSAFNAAIAAANGRTVLVPEGIFRLEADMAFEEQVKFEGTLSMPTNKILLLRKSYDLPTYIEAFGDEELAFRKAFQALLNSSDHESLDMGGRRIAVTKPIDMQAAVPNRTSFATRRMIRNGQLEAQGSSNWQTSSATSTAT